MEIVLWVVLWVVFWVYLLFCYGLVAIPMFGGFLESQNPNRWAEFWPRLLIWLFAPILLPIAIVWFIFFGIPPIA